MDLNNKLKDTFEELKLKAEKLKEKLNMSTLDARREFDLQIDKMQDWIDDNNINSDAFKHISDETKKNLTVMFEELQVQLALAKADGEDAIKDHSRKLNHKIHSIKVEIDKDKRYQELKKDAYSKLGELNDTISILATKFEFDIEDGKELWEEKKEEINKEIDSWSDEFDEIKNKSFQKIEEISDEASKIWNKLRKSF